MDIYQFAIDNMRQYLRSEENQNAIIRGAPSISAFDASEILAIAFMKTKGEVFCDLVKD